MDRVNFIFTKQVTTYFQNDGDDSVGNMLHYSMFIFSKKESLKF